MSTARMLSTGLPVCSVEVPCICYPPRTRQDKDDTHRGQRRAYHLPGCCPQRWLGPCARATGPGLASLYTHRKWAWLRAPERSSVCLASWLHHRPASHCSTSSIASGWNDETECPAGRWTQRDFVLGSIDPARVWAPDACSDALYIQCYCP